MNLVNSMAAMTIEPPNRPMTNLRCATQVFVGKAGNLLADLADADPNCAGCRIGSSVCDYDEGGGRRIGHGMDDALADQRPQRRGSGQTRVHELSFVFAER
jgi:hypothetical protein